MSYTYEEEGDESVTAKSHVALRSNTLRKCNLQKRGHPYMTLAPLRRKRISKDCIRWGYVIDDGWMDPPEWLLSPNIHLQRASVHIEGRARIEKELCEKEVRDPGWPKTARQVQVHYLSYHAEQSFYGDGYEKTREELNTCPGGIPYRYVDERKTVPIAIL